ncbi:MAG TPA: hypothetical protein PK800_06315 [Syntrophorhabdaceae bacterium]|nr:hypothetical protein [Syntrophorhabdaceae bacterium]
MVIGISNWDSLISPLFDVSDRLSLIYVEDGKEIKREGVILKNREPFARAKELKDKGIEVLICGAISSGLEAIILSKGIKVIGFLCGEVQSIFDAFMEGKLNKSGFYMPGYAHRQARHRFQHRRGRNRFPE